jgi:hypothetical protein
LRETHKSICVKEETAFLDDLRKKGEKNDSTIQSGPICGKPTNRIVGNPQIASLSTHEYKDEYKLRSGPAAPASESSKDILIYQDKSGNFLEVTLSEICRRFSFQNYNVPEIREAMQITRDNAAPLDDVFAYIVGIIANLRNKNRETIYNKQVKNVDSESDNEEPGFFEYHMHASHVIEGKKTYEEAEEKFQPQYKQKFKEMYERLRSK